MARRRSSVFDDLLGLPWWASVVFSLSVFIALRFVVPLFIPAGPVTSSNYATKGLLSGLSQAAPFAIVFLIPAPFAAYRQWRERRLLDGQEGLSSIRALSWRRFETLVAEAYRRQGYQVYRSPGDGPDGGVDLVLKKDGETVLVQCKQWKTWKVGVKVVREVYGVVTARKAQGAIIITSGAFTQEARDFAAETRIELVEGQQVADLVREVQDHPPTVPVKPIAPSAATPPNPAAEKVCPRCGSAMVLRTAKQGVRAGQQFWGCTAFPRCRATESVPCKE